jgi:SAM-dependent methyltransferase
VAERDRRSTPAWELKQRDRFLALMEAEEVGSVLELGAATGEDSLFFRERGLDTVCVDLSPEMVSRCRERGLDAHVMDVVELDFPAGSFGAVYAMNCLVHVPESEVRRVLKKIGEILAPGGLFYLGIYGGYQREGVWDDDHYEPKRFFSFRTDEHWRSLLEDAFTPVSFELIPEGWDGLHFQSFISRREG